MKLEQEITVLVTCTYSELDELLKKQNFVRQEEYDVIDIYMVPVSINVNSIPRLELLQNCVIIRTIQEKTKTLNMLLYKYKEYASNGDILKQGKVKCHIKDTREAKLFMEAVRYKKLLNINDHCIVYKKDNIEICVQLVNQKYIFIELEDKENADITMMKKVLNSLDLPIKKDNYFVKKALLVLDDVMQN